MRCACQFHECPNPSQTPVAFCDDCLDARCQHDKCRWCNKDERDDHEHGDHVYMPMSFVTQMEPPDLGNQAPEPKPTVFRNKRTGRFQRCRLEGDIRDDPIMDASGCADEFRNDWRMKDVRDGCPACTDDVIENASEPDVMARWELRR